jgi:hypothetical protein
VLPNPDYTGMFYFYIQENFEGSVQTVPAQDGMLSPDFQFKSMQIPKGYEVEVFYGYTNEKNSMYSKNINLPKHP